MSETIDIGPEITALCEKLGLTDKRYVSEITFTPNTATATVLRSRDGSKFIDEETGQVAQDVLEFAVST